MAPSNHTTGGSLTFPAGAAMAPSPVKGAAAEGSGFVDEGELTDDPFKRAGAGPVHPEAFRQSGMRAQGCAGGALLARRIPRNQQSRPADSHACEG
ncbi:hypothetical protein GCM10010256_46070 [Streptomyces coeruleorubidus]|nr:hypothetical protein GCM10010256_46070 [Streptomyces coeruleorubidus]